MTTPLHALDALLELASGPPGFSRDWANARLAVSAPERVVALPDDHYDSALVMAAGAQAAIGEVEVGLQGAETSETTARRAEQLSAFGLLPTDRPTWTEKLRGALRGDGRPGDLYLVQLLADLDALEGRDLATASQVSGPEAQMALPALVMRYATQGGADPGGTAAAVAEQLAARSVSAVGVRNVLALLGVPHLDVAGLDDEAAVVLAVAERMGADVPDHPRPRGSARRRSQKVVRHLLDGVSGPAAAMIGAVSNAEIGDEAFLVAAAAWVALSTDGPALHRVASEMAGEDRRLLSAARVALREETDPGAIDPALRRAVDDARLELCPPCLLVLDRGSPADWLEPMLERFVRDPDIDVRTSLATTLLFARSPERVAALIGARETRSVGLLFARLVPTEEVLAALLELPTPGSEAQLELYVGALAEMGDRAVLPALERVAGQHRAGAEALSRARDLLGG